MAVLTAIVGSGCGGGGSLVGNEDAVAIVAGAAGMAPGAPPGAASAPGMVVANGADEKLLGGNGGREGAPVDEVFDAAGLRGGICDSWTMLTLVSLFAIA